MKNAINSRKGITVSELVTLLDKDENKRGGASGRERILTLEINGEFMGTIKSAKLNGWGDGLVTDVCLELSANRL